MFIYFECGSAGHSFQFYLVCKLFSSLLDLVELNVTIINYILNGGKFRVMHKNLGAKKLFTPGPLGCSLTTKQAMLRCRIL